MANEVAIQAADPATALTPQELARLGQLAGSAGLSGAETVALVSTVEMVAASAARAATLAMMPAMLGLVTAAHVNAATEIANRVSRQSLAVLHTGCVAVARQVSKEAPKL